MYIENQERKDRRLQVRMMTIVATVQVLAAAHQGALITTLSDRTSGLREPETELQYPWYPW
jgi:hypothetical protein